MPNLLIKRVTFGLMSPILAMLLSLGPSLPAFAQTKPQVDLTGKNVLVQDSGVSGASGQSDLSSKKVLILHSFAYAQPAYKIIDAALIESFVANGLDFNNLYFEFLDLARNPGQEYRDELVKIFRDRFKGRKLDLVLALHQEALQFLLKEGQDIYPEGPIISILGDVTFLEHSDLKRPIIHLPFTFDVISTAKGIFSLQPDTRKIFVIAGSSALDRRFEDVVMTRLKAWKRELDVESLPPLPLADILKKVANLPAGTAILYTTVYADSSGKTFIPADVGRMISKAANAPVFGLFETLLGDNGIVGGIILNHRVEGERAVQLAMEIIHGNLPQKPLTILPAPLVPMFDWLQLKRWGFTKTALPANAIILNKPVSPWERYKYYIIGALIFCLAETALIIFLIVQRGRRKVAEVEVARSRAELLRVERLLRVNEMTASLAHELNQPLAAILSNAQAALRFLKSDKPDLNEFREIIQDIISDDQRAGNVIRSLRSMVKREEVDRSPIILNNVLSDVIEIFHTESIFRNVHVETELDGSLPPVLGDKVQLQQVVLNLILNAADAMSQNPLERRKIILWSGVKDDRIRVTVRDFGPGIDKVNLEHIFDPFFTTKRAGLGIGLAVCHTIVEAHGGRIWAENNPDGGATFVIELPICGSGN